MIISCIILVIGFAMLVKGADWFVEGASGLADKLRIPQIVVGLTIVAMGTSAPEAAVSINASLKGNSGIAIGNVIGSNIFNIFIILGITCIICALTIQKTTFKIDIPYMIAITVVLIFFGLTGQEISRLEGVILWILFIAYITYLIILARKNRQEEIAQEMSLWKIILGIVIGCIVIVWGSNLTVDSATDIAQRLGISDRIIGLTIVACGTSLPELVASVTAARKGNADIAIGNIVGSNIFNILFILGTATIITPVEYGTAFIFDGIIAVVAGVLLWIAVARKKELRFYWGIIMLACYVAYIWCQSTFDVASFFK